MVVEYATCARVRQSSNVVKQKKNQIKNTMSSYQTIQWTISFALCVYCLLVTRFYCSHPPYTLHTHTTKTEITFYDRILTSLSDISVRQTGTLFFWCNDYVYPAAAEVHKRIIRPVCAQNYWNSSSSICGTCATSALRNSML